MLYANLVLALVLAAGSRLRVLLVVVAEYLLLDGLWMMFALYASCHARRAARLFLRRGRCILCRLAGSVASPAPAAAAVHLGQAASAEGGGGDRVCRLLRGGVLPRHPR